MRRGHRSGVLGWELAGDAHDGIVLVPSDDTGFRVRFLGSRARKAGQNRMHYDLTSTSPEDQQERRWRRRSGRAPGTSTSANAPEEGHVVLADPTVDLAEAAVRPAMVGIAGPCVTSSSFGTPTTTGTS